MNFSEALYKMKEGKKVKNEFLNKHGCLYMFLDKEKGIMIRTLNDESDEVYESLSTEELLSENWEIYEEPKWKPKEKELYFYIISNGDIEFSYYKNKSINDKSRICNIGNFFKTDEEAKHMVEKLRVIKELGDFALENNEEEIDWENRGEANYLITYNYACKELETAYYYYTQYIPFNIYFTSREVARKAIETIGEDRIKKYYFDIEEELGGQNDKKMC